MPHRISSIGYLFEALSKPSRTRTPTLQYDFVDLIRRDLRGVFYVQIKTTSTAAFNYINTKLIQTNLTMGTLGNWKLILSQHSPYQGKICVVLQGVTHTADFAQLPEDIWVENCHAWSVEGTTSAQLLHPRRLNRHDGYKWIPSLSVAIWVS